MPLSDFLSDTLASIGQSVKKLPTATVGGVADIGNLILGGYAGIGEALQGKPISRSIGEGLVDKPTGGSEQLNDLFGLSNKSTGLVENSMSAMLGVLNPATALKTAMIVPAVLLKSGKTIQLAEAALGKGKTAQEVFGATGVYKDPADGMMKAVMNDSASTMKTSPLAYGDANLGDVLNHPALFEAYPELAKVKVSKQNLPPGQSGSFSLSTNTIKLDSQNLDQSVLLHEVQHAIQEGSGFATGSNPSMFFARPEQFSSAVQASNAERIRLKDVGTSSSQVDDIGSLLEAKNAEKMANVLKGANRKAIDNYINTAGEKEARVTQQMFDTKDYTGFPIDMSAGSTGRLISDPLMGNKVDNDPAVSAVVRYLNSLIDSSPK